MKHLLLFIATIITFTCAAQTKPPTMAKLIQLRLDTNMAAINNYAHQLGFKGEPFGYNAVGNTYDYMHYGFSSKDTTTKQHTYLRYTWGQHTIHMPYTLTEITYGTNSQAEYDTLIKELLSLGYSEKPIPSVEPGWKMYEYKGMNITTHLSINGGTRYNIQIGGSYY